MGIRRAILKSDS
jgi:hypothetical protein